MPGRKKSALITRVPLMSLSPGDFKKVQEINLAYAGILSEVDERSYHEIRQEIKPYIFTFEGGQDVTLLAKTKPEAIEKFTKMTYIIESVVKIEVEYEDRVQVLLTPAEQKAARKAKRAMKAKL